MTSPNRAFWLRAAYEEMCSIVKHGTFDLVTEIPPGRKPLQSKWVWKTKKHANGTIERFKGRWVVHGDLQKKGINYTETFAPVTNLVTLHIFLTIVAILDLEMDQLDVISAFLNSQIDTKVFLHQLEGFQLAIEYYCQLHKSIYGLCQGAKSWYMVLHEALTEDDFKRLMADLACWIKRGESLKAACILIAWVDHILIAGSREKINANKAHLVTKFKIEDQGPADMFINIKIKRDRDRRIIYLDQSYYCRDILDLYGMGDCNPCLLPMNPGLSLAKAKTQESLSETEKKRYQVMIGFLGYLMNCSRPDITFAIGKLGLYAACPSEKHLLVAKHVFQYIKGTIDTCMIIGGYLDNLLPNISTFFDTSFANDPDDRRSTFGYMIQFGHTTILWKSKKHKAITLSTTDAEYVATSETTRDIS